MNRKSYMFLGLLFVTVTFFIFFAVYNCSGSVCFGAVNMKISNYASSPDGGRKFSKHRFNQSDLIKVRKINLEGNDVLVYLHIQKTGGATFGRHMVHDLDVDPPCECTPGIKKCECYTRNNRIWLFSRHSVGWQCGLHADWTELNDCVDAWFHINDVPSRKYRRYHYITFLRNPVDRFLSEWQHVQRGATWASARLQCKGKQATSQEVPRCYTGEDWSGVTFQEFVGCKSNLAFNRMTRMLSDLTLVNCYNHTGLSDDFLSATLIRSARENLLKFAFFGIVAEQQMTQFLFEKTFGLRFVDEFEQKEKTHVGRLEADDMVTEDMKREVAAKNKMDVALYKFAQNLFYERVRALEELLGYSVQEYFDRYRDEEGDEYGDTGSENGNDNEVTIFKHARVSDVGRVKVYNNEDGFDRDERDSSDENVIGVNRKQNKDRKGTETVKVDNFGRIAETNDKVDDRKLANNDIVKVNEEVSNKDDNDNIVNNDIVNVDTKIGETFHNVGAIGVNKDIDVRLEKQREDEENVLTTADNNDNNSEDGVEFEKDRKDKDGKRTPSDVNIGADVLLQRSRKGAEKTVSANNGDENERRLGFTTTSYNNNNNNFFLEKERHRKDERNIVEGHRKAFSYNNNNNDDTVVNYGNLKRDDNKRGIGTDDDDDDEDDSGMNHGKGDEKQLKFYPSKSSDFINRILESR